MKTTLFVSLGWLSACRSEDAYDGNQTTGGSTATSTSASTGGGNTTSTSGNATSTSSITSAGGAAQSVGTSSSGGTTAASGGTGGSGTVAGNCTIPAEAEPVDVSNPTTVIGDGTAESCTSEAFVEAVAQGGIITFDCGTDPVTITTTETANVYNKVDGVNNEQVVIDGGGLVTLDGGGDHRILYQDTCNEALIWATSACNSQTFPKLVVQNISFANGLGPAGASSGGLGGGGAIYVHGGTFKAYNVQVRDSHEHHIDGDLAQDLAGGAIYVALMPEPVYFVNCTFENNSGSDGGALGAIHSTSYVINSTFTGNSATGTGMNPAADGTDGGGLGGAIYNDGDGYSLNICGSTFTSNTANELGSGAIFQVVNALNGELNISYSTFTGNSTNGSVQHDYPCIYVEARDKAGHAGVNITNSTFVD